MSGAVSSDQKAAGQSDLAARFDALRIAVLQTGRSIDVARARHGDYDDMCKALLGRNPDQADTFAVLDGHYPAAIDEYDLIVITGSKFGVYEDHDWIPHTQQIVRDALAKGIKLIGICFGHQLIAQAMGAVVAKGDHGFIVGAQDYQVTGIDGEIDTRTLYAWHQDQVMSVPTGAQVIATMPDCAIAGLRYGNTAISLQPHPEFTRAYMAELIEARRGAVVDDALADAALDSLSVAVEPAPIVDMLRSFVLTV